LKTEQVVELDSDIGRNLRITVTLDVFSGRPNPSWQLHGTQAQTLLQMLEGVRKAGAPSQPCEPPGLGYRGLQVTVPSASEVAHWHVFGDCVRYQDQIFKDSGRALEAYQLRSVPERLKRELAPMLPRLDH
jgi:hypothetical protein